MLLLFPGTALAEPLQPATIDQMALEAPPRGPELASATSSEAISALILQTFPDSPVMLEVAKCESRLRQFNEDGTVLMGGGGGNYIGIFQIGIQWVDDAQKLDIDVYTVEGNVQFARYLYDSEIIGRGQPLWRQWECALLI